MATTDDTRAEKAQATPVPLSKVLQDVAVRLGACHSAVALTARALASCETAEDLETAAGWAADELARIEADLDTLDDIMTAKWIDARHLEEKAAAEGVTP